mgnify:FL=1
MTEIPQYLAPLMFGALVAAMLVGFPVAFTLGGLGLGFGGYAIAQGYVNPEFLGTVP